MDNNFNISRPSSTKEILDATVADMQRYKSKIDDVKAEANLIRCSGNLRELQRQDLQETNFINDIETLQTERENFLADKSKEVEKLRQQVKQKKLTAELIIEKFHNKLKR